MKIKFEENIFKGKFGGYFLLLFYSSGFHSYSDSEPIVGLGLFLLKHQFMCNYLRSSRDFY